MYIHAVTDSVMLQLDVRHDFYNIIFKRKQTIYSLRGSDPPSEKFWVHTSAGWAPEPVWIFWERGTFLPLPGLETRTVQTAAWSLCLTHKYKAAAPTVSYVAPNEWIRWIMNMKTCERKRLWGNLRICPHELTKATKALRTVVTAVIRTKQLLNAYQQRCLVKLREAIVLQYRMNTTKHKFRNYVMYVRASLLEESTSTGH
jgi:hypothetical protein